MDIYIIIGVYSTVTDFAKFLGLSISHFLYNATWYESSCNGIVKRKGVRNKSDIGKSI